MKRRLLIGLTLSAASAFLLSGCAVANVISPPFAAAIYATPADAAGAADAVAIPGWVPADATNIRIKTDETKHASIVMFTPTATPPTFTACDPATDPQVDQNSKAPALDETWWPQAINPGTGVTCFGPWHLFGQDGAYYGWTP
ncbi:hypothetical protein GCM10011399_11760 [Subtercola lobariae]|uniref:Lipoprotein n=1 Tax=Subtercola lobariae TaxID=1588641 RepID=A0A917B4P7_9MICO|nr:hypothetical protein GCM10011399_11760 [Subtercola lobariae]